MTEDETKKLLNTIASEFPLSFKSMGQYERQTKVQLWHNAFSNIPVEVVNRAVTQEIICNHSGFAPTIGQVINRILEQVTTDPDSEASEAWNTIIRFIHDHSQDEYKKHFDELPEKIRLLVSVPDLLAIANNSTDQNHNFEKPRFVNQYKTVKAHYEQQMISNGRFDLIADPGKLKLLGCKYGDK